MYQAILTIRDMHSSDAPEYQPTFNDRSALLLTWWCSLSALTIILVRVIGRFCRTNTMYTDDKLMLASIIPLAIRLALAHQVLVLGTNNINLDGFQKFTVPNGDEEIITWSLEEEINRRETGSKIVLFSRLFYVAFLWSQKFCVTEFHKQLNLSLHKPAYKTCSVAIRWSLIVTFTVIMITVLAECQPFPDYWQVLPDPGPKCRAGKAPLYATAVLNAGTNLAIALFPLPAVLTSQLKLKRKIMLTTSLSLSLIPAALAIYRVPYVLRNNSAQAQRTLFASFECLTACFVANAIVLNALARGKGPKRNKFRGPGGADMIYTPEQLARRGRTDDPESAYVLGVKRAKGGMQAAWGSDEDLVKGVGVGLPDASMNGRTKFNRQSAITESSGGSSDAGHGGGQNWPAWSQAWEEGADSWISQHGTEIGRDLILPPAPAAIEWRDRSEVGYNPEDSKSTAELWKTCPEPPATPKAQFPKARLSDIETTYREKEPKLKRGSVIDVAKSPKDEAEGEAIVMSGR